MAFTVEIDDDLNLVTARCDGLVEEREIRDAVELLLLAGRVPAGIDRIVRIETTADLRNLDADTLRRIQQDILNATFRTAGTPAFRSVLIAPSPFHRPIAELYKSIWDGLGFPDVHFSVVFTTPAAAELLGLPLYRLRLGPSAGAAAKEACDGNP